MRPITLSRIIEVCDLASRHKIITEINMCNDLRMSKERFREIAHELCEMNLLDNIGNKKYCSNKNTNYLLRVFQNGSWNRFGKYFYQNCEQYRMLVDLLEGYQGKMHGKSIEELLYDISNNRLPLNRTSLTVLTNWGERLGQIQRNLYNGKFYLIKKRRYPIFNEFKAIFVSSYRILNIHAGIDLRSVYVEIPRMRELVCEKLQITRQVFDIMLFKIYEMYCDRIELAGAPITTIAKKSRFSVRTIVINNKEINGQRNENDAKKDQILCVKLDVEKERKGVMIHGKEYYYIAFHRALI